MLTEINRLAVCLLALCLVGHVFAAAAEPQRFVYKARANDNAPRTPPTIAGKPLGGTPLRYDSGQRQYTLDATVGAKAYTLGLSWGTTDIILNPSTKYAGGVNLKKSTPVAFDKTIQLNYYSDTVTVGGVTAHKVPIGSATKSVIIGNTSNHVVGLFGIAPESRDGGYYDQDKGIHPISVSSGPTPFAVQITQGQGGSLVFSHSLKPRFTTPLSKTGQVWNVDGHINGQSFDGASVDGGFDHIQVPQDYASYFYAQHGLKTDLDSNGALVGIVDCQKGAPIKIDFVGGGSISFSGPESVIKEENACRSLIKGYKNTEYAFGVPVFAKGVVFDLKAGTVGWM